MPHWQRCTSLRSKSEPTPLSLIRWWQALSDCFLRMRLSQMKSWKHLNSSKRATEIQLLANLVANMGWLFRLASRNWYTGQRRYCRTQPTTTSIWIWWWHRENKRMRMTVLSTSYLHKHGYKSLIIKCNNNSSSPLSKGKTYPRQLRTP